MKLARIAGLRTRHLTFEGLEPRMALSAAPVVDLNGPDQMGEGYQILAVEPYFGGYRFPIADGDARLEAGATGLIERMEIQVDPAWGFGRLRAETAGTPITANYPTSDYSWLTLEGPASPDEFAAVLRTATVQLEGYPTTSTLITVFANDGQQDSNIAYATFTLQLLPERATTIGLYDPESSTFMLKGSNTSGVADVAFAYGLAGGGWLPIAGDWDGDGIDTVGLYDPGSSIFYLTNQNGRPYADVVCAFGEPGAGWLPIAGDWDGNGTDTIGLYDNLHGRSFLRNSNTTGFADVAPFSDPARVGRLPAAGHFRYERQAAPGEYNPIDGHWIMGSEFSFGPPSTDCLPLAGDWIGQGYETAGLYDPSSGLFYLRNSHTSGMADTTVAFGEPGAHWLPLAGDWDGPLNSALPALLG